MDKTKFVRYDIWCKKCVREKEDGGENVICNECLSMPVNVSSTKPIRFEPKPKSEEKKK